MTKLMDNQDAYKYNRTFITMAEDGLLLVWDLKKIMSYEENREIRLKNVSKWEPLFAIPFSRKYSRSDELGGVQLLIDIKESKISKENKLYV